VCGIPTVQVNVLIGNPNIDGKKWYDFGFKCNRCYRSFRLCDAFIDGEVEKGKSFYDMNVDELRCSKICGNKSITCVDSVICTGITNFKTQLKNKKIVHYKCLFKEETRNQQLLPLLPRVEGLEILKEGLL